MREQGYQSKIIKAIEAMDGVVVNGTYSKAGIADLVCGWPKIMNVPRDTSDAYGVTTTIVQETVLVHLHIEVKTEKDYHRVMRSVDEIRGVYVIRRGGIGLKKHEPLQIHKLNQVRKLGGKALIAWNIEQVKEYMNED